jgi:GrpB-like predicted nucleotidyltransferase (UPF0157 family)
MAERHDPTATGPVGVSPDERLAGTARRGPLELPSEEEVATRVAALRARETDGRMELLGQSSEYAIGIVPSDPAWATCFVALHDQIATALGPTAIRIEHVGSTSVPGLAAKPIIDIQVSVDDIDAEDAYDPALTALGWPLRLREADHRFFREPAGIPRTTHVHVCAMGSRWERVHLLFRDYLRAHPDRARAYGDLKSALAERYRTLGVSYTEAKGPFIDDTLAAAEQWALETGWRP